MSLALSLLLFLSVSVLLIPNFLVFCAYFHRNSNSSPRLRAFAVQLVSAAFLLFLVVSVLCFAFGCLSATPWPLLLSCFYVTVPHSSSHHSSHRAARPD